MAAAFVPPLGRVWARERARELGGKCTVLVLWGPLRFTLRRLPESEPVFAIQREDGTVERPPWAAE
jgi:hypothetical protein